MKKILSLLLVTVFTHGLQAQKLVSEKSGPGSFPVANALICVDPTDDELVRQSANLLQQDIEKLTGHKPAISPTVSGRPAIIIGSLGKSALIKSEMRSGFINTGSLRNQWEAYLVKTGSDKIVIAGSDRRGTAFGVFELSRQLGISPWYWWADVPVLRNPGISILVNTSITDAPKVKYRGIFLNDEAPALSGWTREKFGGFNSRFYEKVFELILRLKGNYIWPAMWGNKFYDDDSLNIKMADRYGIVIGTSHHEPLMRAHDEWRKYGSGKWNYDSNATRLQQFWKQGMQRATNEKIVTIGMRGDGDEPMSRETATALLEKIVADQREIISAVTRQPASGTPQLWALYKEVQDYYEKGMRVPDDVTLLLCDDNWGNIRKLPRPGQPDRKGGYGIYYHFDYVGGPRNYKWLNTNPLPRVWEQMHLAWEYNAREIWIVNVGDLKPMELPISFFLDYAWNPPAIGPAGIQAWTENWVTAQFGPAQSVAIAGILAKYAKYNARRKPELLDAQTFTVESGEWARVTREYTDLLAEAEAIAASIPAAHQDAYYQLVLHPVKACANLYRMYNFAALNKRAYANQWTGTNAWADSVRTCYQRDSLITLEYHQLNNGKWNHMMSQTHIGYTYWQQPETQKMPEVFYFPEGTSTVDQGRKVKDIAFSQIPEASPANSFYQMEETGISIEAQHFTSAIGNASVKWTVLPDHGRTGSAVTVFPVTAPARKPGGYSPHLEYEIYTSGDSLVSVHTYHSPTLNFTGAVNGLQYAVSIDNEIPQVISINSEDKNAISGIWNKWVSENIIIRQSRHTITGPGKHVLKYWMVDPAVVLQKIILDFGDTEKTYLGPPETKKQN